VKRFSLAKFFCFSAKIYITTDINSDTTWTYDQEGVKRQDMHGPRMHRHWNRRTSCVPKGFLRTRVLKMLSEKPMSGAEIMTEMENKTSMGWRPSPGSVYPLLSWLLDSGYTREVSGSEAGVRRYELTDEGRKLLEEEEQRMDQFKGSRFFGPQFEEWEGPMPEAARELVDSWRNMRRAGFALRRKLREDYSESLAREAKSIVDDFVEKISRLSEMERT